MTLWQATLQQMLILLILIALGFILVKARVLETQAASVLAKLENTVLIPALILNTFCTHFTMEKLRGCWFFPLCSWVFAPCCGSRLSFRKPL